METLPFYVPLVFGLTVLLALFLFYRATHSSKAFLVLLSIWIGIQTVLSLVGFYQVTDSFPPRFPFLLVPPVIIMVVLFNTKWGKLFIDSLDIKLLTLFHLVRIPVEIVLFWLFVHGAVPQLMTFEGRNFDILSGLSAPVVYYYGFIQKRLNRTVLIGWNVACLVLVLNVATHGLLSAPTPLQQLAFEQPNIAILYFPFVLLPAVLVPLVIFAHLVSLRQLLLFRPLIQNQK